MGPHDPGPEPCDTHKPRGDPNPPDPAPEASPQRLQGRRRLKARHDASPHDPGPEPRDTHKARDDASPHHPGPEPSLASPSMSTSKGKGRREPRRTRSRAIPGVSQHVGIKRQGATRAQTIPVPRRHRGVSKDAAITRQGTTRANTIPARSRATPARVAGTPSRCDGGAQRRRGNPFAQRPGALTTDPHNVGRSTRTPPALREVPRRAAPSLSNCATSGRARRRPGLLSQTL